MLALTHLRAPRPRPIGSLPGSQIAHLRVVNNPQRVFVIGGGSAPAQRQDARGLEKARRDRDLAHDAGVMGTFGRRLAFKQERAVPHSGGRERAGRAGGFHAGQRGQFGNKLLEQAHSNLFVGKLRLRQFDAKGQSVRDVRANVGPFEIHEAAHHESGADEEDEGECNFGHDESVAHALAAAIAGSSAATFL